MQKKKKKNTDDLSLMDVFDFNRDDIMSNRNGRLSSKQVQSLHDDLLRVSNGMWRMIFALLIGITVLIVSLPANFMIGAIGSLLLFTGLFIAVEFWQRRRLWRDRRELRVAALDGEILLRRDVQYKRGGLPITTVRLEVEGRAFPVDLHISGLLERWFPAYGRVYYAPHTHRILAVEVQDDEIEHDDHEDEIELVDDETQFFMGAGQ